MYGNLPFYKIQVNLFLALDDSAGAKIMDGGPGAILSFKTFLSFINRLIVTIYGEGNGNPLQCSCLESPRDGGAWWAAVYGAAQSWT